MTPEGRIKRKIDSRLAAYPAIWKFMPVQSGYGKRGLDYHLCVPTQVARPGWQTIGECVVIEAKAPGKDLTPKQETTKKDIERAGGKVFVVDSDESLDVAMKYIWKIYQGGGE